MVFVVFIQFIITVVNRRRQVRTTGNEGVFQQNLVVGYTVQRTQQSFADFDIAQRFIRTYIHTSKYVTQGSDIGDVVFIFVFEQLQIAGSNVNSEVDFAFLQSHSTGVRIVDGQDINFLERNLAIPVFFVSNHFSFSFAVGFYCIRTGADSALFCGIAVFNGLGINNDEQRIAEHTRQSRYRFFCFDDYVLAFTFDGFIFEHGFCTSCFVKGTLDRSCCQFAGQFGAVGEASLIVDVEGPGQLIIGNGPFISQPRNSIHFFIEFNQAFAQAVTHYNPAKVVIGGFQGVSEVGNTKFYNFLVFSFFVAATACCCKCQ